MPRGVHKPIEHEIYLPTPILPEGTVDFALEHLFPPENPYEHEPKRWVNEVSGDFVWSRQQEILESVRDNRYTAVYACHGPGKSFIAARAACWWGSVFPLGDAFIITTAPSWPQIEAILWREMRRAHNKAGLPGRMTLDCQWHMGDTKSSEEMIAMGRKPQDYDEQAFQGIHARRVLVIMDEADGIPQQLFDAVDSIVTNDECRVLAIGNPIDPTSYFAQQRKPGSGWNVISIPVWDTPNFTDEYVPEDVARVLVSRQWVAERERKWGRGSPRWQSKVEAKYPEVADNTLIEPRWLEEAAQRDLAGFELGQYGGDIARMGEDETVVYRNRGGVVRLVATAYKQDTDKTTGMFLNILRPHGANRVPMIVDMVGVGAGVYDQLLREQAPVGGFHGGDRPFNTKRFFNKRAEGYWYLRGMFEQGRVDIDPEDEQLISQLGSLRYWIDGKDKIHIESKEEMKERGLPSPDRADAVMMAVQPGLKVHNLKTRGSSITGDLLERKM